jgi:hypothetical protein
MLLGGTLPIRALSRYVERMDRPGERLWFDLSFRRILETSLADLEERFRANERQFGRTLRANGPRKRTAGSPPERPKWRQW